MIKQIENSEAYDYLIKCMKNSTPFSFIRLGDGEALVLRFPDHCTREDVDFILEFWFGEYRHNLTDQDIIIIRDLLIKSIKNADMIGIPSEKQKRDSKKGINWSFIEKFLEENIDTTNKIICSHEIHLWIQNNNYYKKLFYNQNCNVISCRDVVDGMKIHFGAAEVSQIFIPEEVKYSSNKELVSKHFPDFFFDLVDDLKNISRGKQFFVGAGVLGKIYVDVIKSSGGRAADLGSAFDSWVNWDRRGSVKSNRSGF